MGRKAAFKVGDVVRIERPLFVVRVGYPKCLDDYLDALRGGPAEDSLRWLLKVRGHEYPQERRIAKILREIAKMDAIKDGFGGDERTIHTVEFPWYQGREFEIGAIKYCNTGIYHRGYGSDEDGWDGNSLVEVKRHCLLWLDYLDLPHGFWHRFAQHRFGGYIEAANVVKVRDAAPKSTDNEDDDLIFAP